MTKDVNGKLNDYSISPKIRQVLFQWGYELTKKMCCNSFSLDFLSYFLLFKIWVIAKDYLENKEAIAKRSKIGHKNMTELGEKRISRNYLKKLKPYEDEILPVKQKKIAEKSAW